MNRMIIEVDKAITAGMINPKRYFDPNDNVHRQGNRPLIKTYREALRLAKQRALDKFIDPVDFEIDSGFEDYWSDEFYE